MRKALSQLGTQMCFPNLGIKKKKKKKKGPIFSTNRCIYFFWEVHTQHVEESTSHEFTIQIFERQ